MSFEDKVLLRNAETYADFFLPCLSSEMRLLDAGCGDGTISTGLATQVNEVVGVDRTDNFAEANDYAASMGLSNVSFQTDDVCDLSFSDDAFDACIAHSVLEALPDPQRAMAEFSRVLVPGGCLGAASVDYGGVILEGGNRPELLQFYELRLKLWELEQIANPYLGRTLRRLFADAGFQDIVATTKYICHGTTQEVQAFGEARAQECEKGWFAGAVVKHELASTETLQNMKASWLSWSKDSGAYFAFPFCRAVGYKPKN